MSKTSEILLRAFTFVSSPENQQTEPNTPANTSTSNNNKNFRWRDAITDAFIIAMLNFFSTLSALGAMRITQDPQKSLITAGIAAGIGFFSTLAAKRGLKKT